MEKMLKIILELRDKTLKVHDDMRLKGLSGPATEIAEIYVELSQLLLESLGNYQSIYVTENCVIAPGETRELKTDISKININSIDENRKLEFTNEGFIPTFGYLSFTFERDYENGNKILVTNNAPKDLKVRDDLCGFHYCVPTTTQPFWPGIYLIETGSIIGIAGINNPVNVIENYSDEKEQRDTQEVKDFRTTPMFEHIKKM